MEGQPRSPARGRNAKAITEEPVFYTPGECPIRGSTEGGEHRGQSACERRGCKTGGMVGPPSE
eukprot:8107031-Heterocapsa_arctica.AAC.1